MPLDRVFNGVFKHYYNTELRECIGSGVMPNTRVVMTCVSRALDHICPEVTKAGWRGFYPYDRVGMVPVEEQQNALALKQRTHRGITEFDKTVIYSIQQEQVPNHLRQEPRASDHVMPSSQEEARFVLSMNFTPSDLEFQPDRHLPLAEQFLPVMNNEMEEEEMEEEMMVANFEEIREQVGLPFQRQKMLGTSKKSLAIVGLITGERLQDELERMRVVAEEEEQRKEEKRKKRRQIK